MKKSPISLFPPPVAHSGKGFRQKVGALGAPRFGANRPREFFSFDPIIFQLLSFNFIKNYSY
jgi:hypothetical protein